MPNYKQNYITANDFEAFKQQGIFYIGFVEGLGYAYDVDISLAPPHMRIFAPPRFVPPGMDQYIYIRVRCVDTSEEMVKLSYGYKKELTKIEIDIGASVISNKLGGMGTKGMLPHCETMAQKQFYDLIIPLSVSTSTLTVKNKLTDELKTTE